MIGGEVGSDQKQKHNHKTRKLIYNYVSTHPGASFGVIRNFLDMNESTLKYHLIYLERTKRLSSRREGRHRCYFVNNGSTTGHQPPPQVEHTMEINRLNQNQQYVLKLIRNNPGIDRSSLLKITKMNRRTLSYTIDKLLEQKMIWKVKEAGLIGYEYITKEKLRNEMYNELLMKLLSDEIDEEKFIRIKQKLERLDIDKIEI